MYGFRAPPEKAQEKLFQEILGQSLDCPKGPKIEKIKDLPPRLKSSSEIENFKRATHLGPIFRWGNLRFARSSLNFSSEIEVFKRD